MFYDSFDISDANILLFFIISKPETKQNLTKTIQSHFLFVPLHRLVVNESEIDLTALNSLNSLNFSKLSTL